MKKQTFITLLFSCFSLFGIAQTAVSISKTPMTEPVKNDTAALENRGTQKTVSMEKNATTTPAPEQQIIPATGEEKTTNGRKKPE